MLLRLVPRNTKLRFIKFRNFGFAFSTVAIIASVVLFMTQGLNFGIDFRGGTILQVSTKPKAVVDLQKLVTGPSGLADEAKTAANEARIRELVAAQDWPAALGDLTATIQETAEGDVTGGVILRRIQAADWPRVDLGALRSIGRDLNLGDVQVQEYGSPEDALIRIELQTVEDGDARAQELAQTQVVTQVQEALNALYPDPLSYPRIESVGPKVSGELTRSGTIAVVAAIALMLLYIWFRFEWQFSLGAVLALVHDIVLTIGLFSLLQLEFTLSIIAALLTIVGYSMNDTVVVYDRIRENLRKYKKKDLAELLDLSINDTLSRTTMTSVTTLLALLALFYFGGEVIHGFTFAMIWGVVVGTYSSIFVAAPLLMITDVKRDWSGIESKPATMKLS